MNIKKFQNRFDDNFKLNEPLAQKTTLKIGGKAKYFLIVNNSDDLIWAVREAQSQNLKYYIIGGGSNLLIADTGFDGLVILNQTSKILCQSGMAVVESGVNLSILLKTLAEQEMGGLEFLAGIPGTIGGAVCGNVEAWGKSISDIFVSAIVLGTNGELAKIDKKEMGFGYRTSLVKQAIIKNKRFPPVIISVNIKISPNTKEGILRIINNYITIRAKKNPVGFSAGCVFKNIYVKNKKEIKDNAKFMIIDNIIPTGMLIDKLGFKNKRIGKIIVSDKHANFLINLGKGKSSDYYNLISEIKQKSQKIFGLELQEEIMCLGDISKKPESFWSFLKKNEKDK
jgi:UDP-N-acetylmuramate dehydrogenase